MKNFTRVKTLMFLLLMSFTHAIAQSDTQNSDPCKKENALKIENLTGEKAVLFKGISETNKNWINWTGLSTTAPTEECLFIIKVESEGNGSDKKVKIQRYTDQKYLKKGADNTIEFDEQEGNAAVLTVTAPTAFNNETVLPPTGANVSDGYTLRFTVDGLHLNVQRGAEGDDCTPKFASGTGGWSAVIVYDAKSYIEDGLAATISTYEPKIGTGLGQFSGEQNGFSQKVSEGKKALEVFNSVEEGQPTNEQIKTAITANNNIISASQNLTINQPESGKYYRFKSLLKPAKYISSTKTSAKGSDNVPCMTTNADEAVFYLTGDKRLVTANALCMTNYGVVDNSGTGGTTFSASKATFGGYVIRNNGTFRVNGDEDVMDRHGDLNAGLTSLDAAWMIEEVTEEEKWPKITKDLSSVGYATLAAPIALTIPEGVKAYTVDATSGQAVLTEVNAQTIPGGTAVLLEKTGNGTSFNFSFAPTAETVSGTNNLVGVNKEKEIPAGSYILANGNSGIGFYKVKDSERNLSANKAYLTVPAAQAHLQSIIIGGSTTGIDEIVTEEAAKEIYFDLQGRRIQNPTKGIYVTKSGKKVIFN